MRKHKLLFVLKKNGDTDGYYNSKAGLFNSVHFIEKYLRLVFDFDVVHDIAITGNSLPALIQKHKPTHICLEAIWCPPASILEANKVHPNLTWIIRTHSKVPFLANEGIALNWLNEYRRLGVNVFLAFNSKQATQDFIKLGYHAVYLPNIYYPEYEPRECHHHDINEIMHAINAKYGHSNVLNVGCFGSVRPMKNHLNQAIAAIEYAEKHNKVLHFHINVGSEEMYGDQILKNLRSMFKHIQHMLVEWPWYEHSKFLDLIKFMDFGMQVSLTESFNIVSADFVYQNIPIVVGMDIDWMPEVFRANPNDTDDIQRHIQYMLFSRKLTTYTNKRYLDAYNQESAAVWYDFLRYQGF